MVVVVHPVEVGQREFTEGEVAACFAEDDGVALRGDLNADGSVNAVSSKAGCVQPFSARRKVGFEEVNPNGVIDIHISETHVLHVIANECDAVGRPCGTVSDGVVTGSSCVSDPIPSSRGVLGNGDVQVPRAKDLQSVKNHHVEERGDEIGPSVVVFAKVSSVAERIGVEHGFDR